MPSSRPAGAGARRLAPAVAALVMFGLLAAGRLWQEPSAAPAAIARPTVTIAAASDLRFAFEVLLPRFERDTISRTIATYGSSGQLAAQIAQGAPFDIFFSADESFIAQLASRGRVDPSSARVYATGQLATWTRASSTLDASSGLSVAAAPAARFVAIANPTHAPYGRAAVAALRSAGLWERVRSRLVYGENVSQALQLVRTGNADVGIVALSLVVAPSIRADGRYAVVPRHLHPPLRQTVAIVGGHDGGDALARRLRAFVLGSEGRRVLREFGFLTPGDRVP